MYAQDGADLAAEAFCSKQSLLLLFFHLLEVYTKSFFCWKFHVCRFRIPTSLRECEGGDEDPKWGAQDARLRNAFDLS